MSTEFNPSNTQELTTELRVFGNRLESIEKSVNKLSVALEHVVRIEQEQLSQSKALERNFLGLNELENECRSNASSLKDSIRAANEQIAKYDASIKTLKSLSKNG